MGRDGVVQASTDPAETGHLRAGKRITVEELAVQASAVAVWLRQVARAAETPAEGVELAELIELMRRDASTVARVADELVKLAGIVAGHTPVAVAFPRGDSWGAAALSTERDDYGGPAVIPSSGQLLWLAQLADPASDGRSGWRDQGKAPETTTYPEAMAGVRPSLIAGWESKAAAARRRHERDAAVAREVLVTECATCGSADGQQCTTKGGQLADRAHIGRQREAESTVDARLSYLGPNPVAVPAAAERG